MKQIKLSKRLETIAQYVKQDTDVIDVGTDHGYIPAYLAQNKIAKRIIATDLRTAPLKRAQLSAEEYAVQDQIEFILTDGLCGIDIKGIDTVIIAGMGGETIIKILENAPCVRKENIRFILQPQSKISELSFWLSQFNFEIIDETLVSEDGKIYLVMLVGTGRSKEVLTLAESNADRLLMEKRDPLLPAYLDSLIRKTERAIFGMEQAENENSSPEIEKLKTALFDYIQMKGETETW